MALLSPPFSPSRSSKARRSQRPPPLRTQSTAEGGTVSAHTTPERPQSRRNSTFSPFNSNPLSPQSSVGQRSRATSRASPPQRHAVMSTVPISLAGGLPTPPTTPSKSRARGDSNDSLPDCQTYDFSKLDYELQRARIIGTGLWSEVLLVDAAPPVMSLASTELSPPKSPRSKTSHVQPSLYAVKTPLRKDAKEVFAQEARILTHLMRQEGTSNYVVPFYGYDVRNSSLVFEAVIGGSLENLNTRLKQMTEVARHLELISIFPGIAFDLVSGLAFLHANGVVHADLKPANVLLDISDSVTDLDVPQRPVIRARYIDFSASFRPDHPEDSTQHSGGTWDYMAPEQMRLQKEFNTPTPASDIWSLGITLLSLIVGGSPYTATVEDNVFMLREAIKAADPISFARAEPKVSKRIAACQDFVDCVRLALINDRDRRTTAAAWKRWIEVKEL